MLLVFFATCYERRQRSGLTRFYPEHAKKQRDRDEFADLKWLKPVVKRLGERATLHLVEGGDHSFKVLKRSGKTESDVMDELVEAMGLLESRNSVERTN